MGKDSDEHSAMTLTIADIDKELAEIRQQLEPLHKRAEELNRTKRLLKSKMWIEANNVTKDKVQLSSGDGVPYHGVVTEFGKWLATLADPKPFAEWNETIYFTHDLINGRMPHGMPATIHELPV